MKGELFGLASVGLALEVNSNAAVIQLSHGGTDIQIPSMPHSHRSGMPDLTLSAVNNSWSLH